MAKNVKRNVLPHSQAKLDLYKSYISMYLPILGYSPYVSAINVFDIFCGTGIYDDGKLGSPLIAASCIQDFENTVSSSKPVPLFINDFDHEKVTVVKKLIHELKLKNCDVSDFNLDAAEMFKIVAQKINASPKSERSLVFIDPYGYSKISRESIISILQNGKSEIILFLPVAHMKRFSEGALKDYDNKAYENLRRFINDFLPDSSPIKRGVKIDVFDFIEELRKAFSFGGKFYTASHYIERDAANYYALFFIGSHIYGLEKFVEAKWSNASLGKGFNQKDRQPTLWGESQVEVDHYIIVEHLEKLLRHLFEDKKSLNNVGLYEFTLSNQFKPTHMNDLLRRWLNDRKLCILDLNGHEVRSTRTFGLTYDYYKENKVIFTFKRS